MPLKVVAEQQQPEVCAPEPPERLEETGLRLWRHVMSQYALDDAGGLEMLAQACTAADRAERCRRAINEDGEVIRAKTGLKDHPLLKHETAARALAVRTLARLGLDLEPVRPTAGRPPGR